MLLIFYSIIQFMFLCQKARGMNNSCQVLHVNVLSGGEMPFKLLEYSMDQFHEVHSNFTLRCEFENYCSITWYYNGITLDAMGDQNSTYRLGHDNQTVTIDDVMEGHQGTYTCIASNGTNTVSRQTYLRVYGVEISGIAIYNAWVSDEGIYVSEQLRLYCYTANYVTITWYRDGVLITEEGDPRVEVQSESQVLIIEEIAITDRGVYSCVASNGTHNDSREGKVYVSHECRDNEILLRECSPSEAVIAAPLGSNLTINCVFSIGLDPGAFRYNWYRFNETGGGQLNDTSLYVAPSSDYSSDEGTKYKIVLTSEGGKNNACTNRLFYSASLIIPNVTEGTYGYYIIYGYRNWAVDSRIIQIVPEVSLPASLVVRSAPVGSSVGCLLVLLMIGSLVWRRYRLDVKLFVKEARENVLANDRVKQGDRYLYDVYIACCDVDATAVLYNIVPALKERGYSTCFRITDILPGGASHDEIWRCMKASRSCLLILSDHQMCQDNIGHVEVQAAVSLLKNGIVPVLMEPVTKSKMEAYPVFRYLLKTNPKILCRIADLAHPTKFRRSSAFKRMRLGLPSPSEKRRQSGIALRGYLDDEFRLIGDDWSTSSDGTPSYDLEAGVKPPEIVVTPKTQCYTVKCV